MGVFMCVFACFVHIFLLFAINMIIFAIRKAIIQINCKYFRKINEKLTFDKTHVEALFDLSRRTFILGINTKSVFYTYR